MEKVKKVTKRENFTAIKDILEGLGRTDLIAVMEHELELLAKKNSADRKPTKVQEENENIKNIVFSEMLPNTLYTISEMQKNFDLPLVNGEPISNQKLSALVNRMVDEGRVTKTIDKRRSYFTKVGE